ncbi:MULTISPECIES: LysE family translocator [Malaciobacter]|uniref:LysE family translocator n=1 Tax=Malaciobacter TaxID=2321114 RepID=UPI00384CA537
MELFLSGFIPLATAHFIALLSPGVDFFILVSTSSKKGKLAGVYTAFGISIANGIFIAFALLGIVLIKNNPTILETIKILGVIYIIYISYNLIVSKQRKLFIDKNIKIKNNISFLKEFLKGFLSAILNPKNSIFYFTLFSLFSFDNIPFLYQTIYAIWMFLIVLIWDIFIVFLINHKKNRNFLQKYSNLIEKISGIILFFIACIIIFNTL